jgi:hypothetical protein
MPYVTPDEIAELTAMRQQRDDALALVAESENRLAECRKVLQNLAGAAVLVRTLLIRLGIRNSTKLDRFAVATEAALAFLKSPH